MMQMKDCLAGIAILIGGGVAGGCVEASDTGELGAAEQAIVGAYTDAFESNAFGDNAFGVSMAQPTDRTCFLAGVAGNLGKGTLWDYSSQRVFSGNTFVMVGGGNYVNPDGPVLYARGGYYLNQVNQPVWAGNKVQGQANCVAYPASANEHYGSFSNPIEGAFSKHVIIASGRRQCFLDALVGGDGSWKTASTSVRVQKRKSGLFVHWFLEGEISHNGNGIWPSVGAVCIDFPADSEIVEGTATAAAGAAVTKTLVPGPHSWVDSWVCGITGVDGAFKTDSYSDGVEMIEPVASGDGSWKLRVTNGKTAHWACVR